MTKASRARKANVSVDDVKIKTIASTALVTVELPQAKTEQPGMSDDFWQGYRKAIKAQFNGSIGTVAKIAELKLTPSDTDAIEKLRAIFYDQWLELIFAKAGETPAQAAKHREIVMTTTRSKLNEDDMRAYTATKVAWLDVRFRAGLKDAPKPRGSEAGQTSSSETPKDKTIDPAVITNFEDLFNTAIDIAKLLDLVVAKTAAIKSSGLRTALDDAAKAIRVAAHTSRDALNAK